jgi:hypothetical protein
MCTPSGILRTALRDHLPMHLAVVEIQVTASVVAFVLDGAGTRAVRDRASTIPHPEIFGDERKAIELQGRTNRLEE